jgi:hypothetical protein
MQYFVILTLQVPGQPVITADAVVTVNQHATRQQIYQHMVKAIVKKHGAPFASANVVFFSAESNRLGS